MDDCRSEGHGMSDSPRASAVDPSLVVLADGAHRRYARRTGEARGRVTVEISGDRALTFDATSGRLVSPRGHRPPYRLVLDERPTETGAPPEEPEVP